LVVELWEIVLKKEAGESAGEVGEDMAGRVVEDTAGEEESIGSEKKFRHESWEALIP